VLNLSNNKFGKDGVAVLANVLHVNKIIQVLDLSKNQMGVLGAH
jgi:hypothetical protein